MAHRFENWFVTASDPKVDGIELEGCKGVMSVREHIDGMDGDISGEVEPVGTPNESEMLITMSIKLEDLDSGDLLCMP